MDVRGFLDRRDVSNEEVEDDAVDDDVLIDPVVLDFSGGENHGETGRMSFWKTVVCVRFTIGAS